MKQSKNKPFNPGKIAEIFFYLFIFSLFFPIRYVFITSTTFKTGVFLDFTSISLYLSDILLVITFLWLILPRSENQISRGKAFYQVIKGFWVLTIWLILDIIWHFKAFSSLNAFYFIKFLEFIVAYGTVALLFQETRVKLLFFKLFAALGTVQAGLVLGQFLLQRPLGLSLLGEQQVFTWNQGIAKLVANGITYVRGYGTFPHPNPLSAYLLATIFILIYLFTQAEQKGKKIVYSLMIAGTTLGLIATFSRAAFLALGLGLLIFFGYFLYKHLPKINFVPLGTILLSLVLAFIIFRPFLLIRATISDSASLERVFYAKVGWQIIKANPVFGVGVGESVLHMEQYSPVKLWPWQIQPIHNYFELFAADLGIIGVLILLWIFWSHLWKLVLSIRYMVSKSPPLATCYLLLATILTCFLLLMLFDHYFYTLQQTQLLLWLLLGIIAAETKNLIPEQDKA